jgi:hypothetical protein
MPIIMHLPEHMPDCPQAWRNLIADMRQRIPPNDFGGYTIKTLQKELKQYRAVFDGGDLIFTDERMYNLFILKYSASKEYRE